MWCRVAYHGGDLNGKNIQQIMFQESDIIFSQFQELLVLGVNEEDGRCNNKEVLIDIVRRYYELCTLFVYLFSLARTPTGELTGVILDKSRQCPHVTMLK
jgi:hypothetical protein